MSNAQTLNKTLQDVNNYHGGIKSNLSLKSGYELDIESGASLKIAGTKITATADEINKAADVSARTQELTASGAVTAGVQSVELNHASTTVAATIADASDHQGLFIVKDTSASGTASHTLTLTAGTFDGTNNKATLDAPGEALVVYFDSNGDGVIVENIGSVTLASV